MERRHPIAIVLGTKAELIKMSPVMHELSREGVPYVLIYTGQHNIDAELREHSLRRPDFIFDSGAAGRGRFRSKASASAWSLAALSWTRRVLGMVRPSLVMVHGDTMTTAVGALAAKTIRPRVRLAHVEAGLRSGSLREPFPEELSRRLADRLADICFAPTYYAAGNLLAEGKRRDAVVITGNTNIDVAKKWLRRRSSAGKARYVIAKLHRHENITSRKRLSAFLRALGESPLPVVLILPENLERQMARFGLEVPEKTRTLRFLPQGKFLALLRRARAIITDAGGETEEAAFFGVPCIQFREKSERQEAEMAGAAVRTINPERIRTILLALAHRGKPGAHFKAHAKGIFGEGDAAKKIVAFLKDNVL